MSFSSSNFIASYVSTSKTIRILDSGGTISFSINVCNYQKAAVFSNILKITLEDSDKEYTLDFATPTDAIVALSLLKQTVDTLIPNCVYAGAVPPPPPAGTPIAITYLAYKTLQTTSSLVPLQYYDITDTTGLVIDIGTTIRVLALAIDDSHPLGEVLDSSHATISLNTQTDDVISYERPANRVQLINTAYLPQDIDASSTNIIVKNNSTLTATNSQYVEVENNSVVTATNSNNLKVSNNSNTNVSNAGHVSIDNIQQNLSSLSFSLSNVIINQTDSQGKLGRGTSISGNTTIQAYGDFVEQVITINSSNSTTTVTLQNQITQANSEFRLKYTGSGTGNVININNIDASLLYVLNDKNKDFWVVFRYVKSTGFYEFIRVDYGDGLNGYNYLVNPVTNNQTSFVLPVAALLPSKMALYINGQKNLFGVDFTYSSLNQAVTYLNSSYSIVSTDSVEFIIY